MTETPQDFDFDAWLEGAERPERSVTVYQKASLIADLDALEAKILAADDDEDDVYERGLTQADPARKLRAEYQKLAKQFHDSALTIRVQGHDEDEKREIAKANKDLLPGELGYVILADAITSPKVTADQLKRLAKKVGEAQFNQIPAAYQKASSEIPVVSADFLPKSSTRDDGGE
jgi:hypothetical protein